MSWANFHIEKLQKGEIVKFRPKGNSMLPKIKSGQLVTILPLKLYPKNLCAGDVVLCKVKGKQYLHMISAIRDKHYQISNNQNFINGWTTIDFIYGVLVEIE